MKNITTLLSFCCILFAIEIAVSTPSDDTENDLKRWISMFSPLAEMFLPKLPSEGRRLFKSSNNKRRQGTAIVDQKDYTAASYGSSYTGASYGDYASSSSGYNQYLDDGKDDLLPVLAVLALSSLLFYLITVATTSSTAGRRKRYTQDVSQEDIAFMDPGTWMSLVHNIWDDEQVMANEVCIQRELCAMNRIAKSVSTDTGLAVSLSSLPLSYLLHHRQNGGFLKYFDASLAGTIGGNCSMIYHQCQID